MNDSFSISLNAQTNAYSNTYFSMDLNAYSPLHFNVSRKHCGYVCALLSYLGWPEHARQCMLFFFPKPRQCRAKHDQDYMLTCKFQYYAWTMEKNISKWSEIQGNLVYHMWSKFWESVHVFCFLLSCPSSKEYRLACILCSLPPTHFILPATFWGKAEWLSERHSQSPV